MGKPTTDASGDAPATSLLSSVAGLLESGVMGIFGTASGSAGGDREAMSHAHGDHVGQKNKASMFVVSASPRTSHKQQSNTHGAALIYKHGSDSGSYCDMPELNRLGGGATCPASSEEEEVRTYVFMFGGVNLFVCLDVLERPIQTVQKLLCAYTYTTSQIDKTQERRSLS